MNYCTKCQSIYSTPGTCNCYAPAGTLRYVGMACPPPVTSTITVWPGPIGGGGTATASPDAYLWNGPLAYIGRTYTA